jgi:hypothetical protein
MAAVPDAYISRADLARQLNRNERTLERCGSHGTGPAITRIGKSPHYRNEFCEMYGFPHAVSRPLSVCLLNSRRRSMLILNNRYNER